MTGASPPLRIGIAGLGIVGAGTFRLLRDNAELLATRTGRQLTITAVSARDPGRARELDLAGVRWHGDARALADDAEVDLVCELIGGSEGVALDLVRAALRRGRPVVTANKAMLALHGDELARLAEGAGAQLRWEAAVAGGIPIIRSLSQGLVANRILGVYGILNGTCNFILTTMRETGREFADVLAEAQSLGYAEADPAFDVDGIDAAHKLALLAALAFGGRPRFDAIHIEGIRHVSAMDIAFADQLGYRIKLLGVARMTAGRARAADAPLHGAGIRPDRPGRGRVQRRRGRGRPGGSRGPRGPRRWCGPDRIGRGRRHRRSRARGSVLPTFGVPATTLADHPIAPMSAHAGSYYIRLMVLDVPGVLADISAVLRDHEVSIESLIQRGRNPGQAVPIVLTSHDTTEARMRGALERIAALPAVLEPPRMIRIERS